MGISLHPTRMIPQGWTVINCQISCQLVRLLDTSVKGFGSMRQTTTATISGGVFLSEAIRSLPTASAGQSWYRGMGCEYALSPWLILLTANWINY